MPPKRKHAENKTLSVATATPPPASSSPSGVDSQALADIQAYSNLREKRKKAKRKKLIIALVVCFVCLAVLVGGGSWFLNSMSPEQIVDEPMGTTFVEKGTFLDAVSTSGKLKPIASVSATPEVDGHVGEVFVSEGDTVTKGQELYTIVNDDLDKAVSQAQQTINEAANGVELAQLSVDNAYRAKSSGIAAAEEAARAVAAARAAQAQNGTEEGSTEKNVVIEDAAPFDVGEADANIRQAELSLASANASLSEAREAYERAVATAAKRRVVSPIDGSVVSVSIEPGSKLGGAGEGATTPVQIADLSQMQISVEVNEIDVLKISSDQIASITFSSLPDVTLQGKVTHIATVNTGSSDYSGMDPYATVTYTVSILIEKPDARLKPGMSGKASIEVQRLDDVLMVPLSAVMMYSDTEGAVYLFDSENPEEYIERSIEILASDGLMVAIKGDISEADEVVLVGGGGMMGDMGAVDDLKYSETSVSVG